MPWATRCRVRLLRRDAGREGSLFIRGQPAPGRGQILETRAVNGVVQAGIQPSSCVNLGVFKFLVTRGAKVVLAASHARLPPARPPPSQPLRAAPALFAGYASQLTLMKTSWRRRGCNSCRDRDHHDMACARLHFRIVFAFDKVARAGPEPRGGKRVSKRVSTQIHWGSNEK
jgi:hypothetical protein